MKRILLIIVASNIILYGSLNGQTGKTGFSSLKLGVGARSIAMGEAYTAIASDPSGIYYNPSALSLTKTNQILLMHKEWIQDTRTEFIGAKTSVNDFTFGIGINSTTISKIELRTVPGPAQGTFTARYATIGISSAYEIDTSIFIGATAKLLYEKILIDDASGLGFDLGGTYKTPWSVCLAFAVNNLGHLNELRNEATQLPRIIRVGGAYNVNIKTLDGTITASTDLITIAKENNTHLLIGFEFNYMNMFSLRAGYQTSYESKNISAGFGFSYELFRFDYAFVPFRYEMGASHIISLGIEF